MGAAGLDTSVEVISTVVVSGEKDSSLDESHAVSARTATSEAICSIDFIYS